MIYIADPATRHRTRRLHLPNREGRERVSCRLPGIIICAYYRQQLPYRLRETVILDVEIWINGLVGMATLQLW